MATQLSDSPSKIGHLIFLFRGIHVGKHVTDKRANAYAEQDGFIRKPAARIFIFGILDFAGHFGGRLNTFRNYFVHNSISVLRAIWIARDFFCFLYYYLGRFDLGLDLRTAFSFSRFTSSVVTVASISASCISANSSGNKPFNYNFKILILFLRRFP
jgi:hypothetical protein